jgi:hypothetical protein
MLNARALPLIAISLILYNALLFAGASLDAKVLPEITLPSGGVWKFTLGDLLILITIVLFFVEIIKSTFTGSVAIIDHALSMIVFIICVLEFLLVKQAATSVFFFIMVLTLVDVVAGYTIGIKVARRDISLGHADT